MEFKRMPMVLAFYFYFLFVVIRRQNQQLLYNLTGFYPNWVIINCNGMTAIPAL